LATNRVRFQKEIEERLRCWGVRRGALAKKLEKAGEEQKAGLSSELTKLRALEAEGRRCLSVVEAAGAAAWARLQTDFVERWQRADQAAEAVWARAK
jgi:hypothetical protein